MKFRFCGDADCPDWVLSEINTISRLSSIKLKLLCQVVAKGILNPPVDFEKAKKLFADSKLDSDIDLKSCIACLTYIFTSTTRFNCDSNALQSELQQLGLPREHSTSIKRVADDQIRNLTNTLRRTSLKIKPLEKVSASVDCDINCVLLNLVIDGESTTVTVTPKTLQILLDNLKQVKSTMLELKEA